jgi:hypothetical protein
MRTADDYRAMWDMIERLWAETVARAGRLPEPALHQRVDDEWSFVETLRYLVFATGKWVGYTILKKPMPYHGVGLPATAYPPADAATLGIDLDVRPPLAELLEVRGTRMTKLVTASSAMPVTGSPRSSSQPRPSAMTRTA